MRLVTLSVDTAGAAGNASGAATSNAGGWVGRLVGAIVRYDAGCPATTDVTITDEIGTVLTLANQKTNRTVQPFTAGHDNAGVALAAGTPTQEHPIVQGTLTMNVAQCDQITRAVAVTLCLEY